jgi:DNA-binding NarL/FixJ family response regulator
MKPRLVLVEDHVLVRESIRAFLQEAAFDVVGEASTGSEAVQLANELQPDLVLLDIHLPEMNGIEAARRIRQQVPDTRLIALTAYNEKAYQRAFANAGAHGFVLKTAAFSELLSEIQRVLADPNPADGGIDPSSTADEHALTKREHEVLSCAAKGWTNKQIGAYLHISDRTVQVHLQTIYQKLDATSRTEAVSRAIARGIISPVDKLDS